MALFEAKKEHFRHSVYLIADVVDNAASDGGTKVVGINLTRSAESRWSSKPLAEISNEALTDSQVANLRKAGVTVHVGLGGPVTPRKLSYAVLVTRERYEIGDPKRLQEEALALAQRGAPHDAKPELRLFLGTAHWSVDQVLGEIARQSWAVVPNGATVDDLRGGSPKLWRSLEDAKRLHWAPSNPMADEYNQRITQPSS